MKKTLWLVLILLFVCMFTFSACDSGDAPSNDSNGNNQQTTTENNENSGGDENNNSSNTTVVCQHTFANWNTVKQATCKEEGKLVRTCSKCSETEESIVSKTDVHTEVVDAAVSATCIVDGKTEGKHCSVCGKTIIEQTVVKASGHTEVIDSAVDATCNVEGKTEGKHCYVCNTIIIKQTSLGYSSHDYKNGVCSVCMDIDETVKDAEIEAENKRHEAKIKEIEDAYAWLVQTNEERIAELKSEHGISYIYDNLTCYEKVADLEADITDLSQRISRLEIYNDPSDLSTIASLKNQKKSKEAEKAKYEAMISIHRYEDAILSHTDSYNSDIEKENALNENNLSLIDKKYDCYQNKHNVTTIAGKAPTCENSGITEGLKCQSCNVVFVQQSELSATGHTSDDETGTCKTCGANLFEAGLIFTLNNAETGYIISDYTGSNSAINIPDMYEGLPVVEIGNYAFFECTNLENITLPESVTRIGKYAFYECEKLKSIVIGTNVQYIGEGAFHYCIRLENIYFNATELPNFTSGNYVFSYAGMVSDGLKLTIGATVKHIPDYMFNPGSADIFPYITSVVFEENSNCISIGQSAFSGCCELTSLSLGNGITTIGMFAFNGCIGLIELYIPDNVTNIGYGAFQNCSNLTTVHIGLGLKNVGSYAFGSCDKLSKVYIKDLEKWCNITFEHFGSNPLNCSSLNQENKLYLNNELVTQIIVPTGVENVGDFAFERCYDVNEVVIPEGVKTIGQYSFRACTAMTSLTISSTVTKIDEYAFYFCTSLTTIKFEGTIEQWKKISLGNYWCYNVPATAIICTNGTINLNK